MPKSPDTTPAARPTHRKVNIMGDALLEGTTGDSRLKSKAAAWSHPSAKL
jgi:hypothetical protein